MTIRWKRGFFRAWVVFAVLWIAGAASIFRLSMPADPFEELEASLRGFPLLFPDRLTPSRTRSGCEDNAKGAEQLQLKDYKYDLEACVRLAHQQNWEDFGKLMWMFLPPALILIFGVVVGWTIQGFRP